MQYIKFLQEWIKYNSKRNFIFIWKVWPEIQCKKGRDAGLFLPIE